MTEHLRRELKRWGFSDTEISVYVTALQAGEARASEVAERADVSTRHVYRISERLEDRGLVEVDDHRQPTVIRPTPPDQIEETLEESYDTILEEVEAEYVDPPDRATEIEVIKSDVTTVKRCRELIDGVDDWMIFVAPRAMLAELAAELTAARRRGALVLVLTTAPEADEDLPFDEFASAVRVPGADDLVNEIILGIGYYETLMVPSDHAEFTAGEYGTALYFDRAHVTPRINGSVLTNEWRLGDEHYVTDPIALPHTFDVFQKALFHAALHRRRGTPLRATVEGRHVEDGTTATVAGDVESVHQGMVAPYEKSFLFEQSLFLQTSDGRVSVGGPPADLEDYAAARVTLERAEDES